MDKTIFEKAGIDYDEGLARFANKCELYEKYLKKFLDDKSFDNIFLCIEKGDFGEAFKNAHTLKGVAGNLSLKKLYSDIFPLVEELRNENPDDNLNQCCDNAKNSYKITCEVLKQL